MITRYQLADLCLPARYYVFLVLIAVLNISPLQAQDLIDRTRHNVPLKASTNPNSIAEHVSQYHNFQKISPFKFTSSVRNLTKSGRAEEYINLKFEQGALQDLLKSQSANLRLQIPVDKSHLISILLYRVDLLTADYQLVTSMGIQNIKEESRPVFYRGIVEGDQESLVSMVVSQRGMKVSIHDRFGDYEINRNGKKKDNYYFYNVDKTGDRKRSGCATDDVNHQISQKVQATEDRNWKNYAQCIPLFIETDKFTYDQFNGDIGELQDYVVSLINDVAALYENEQISISLAQLYVATEVSDDWSAPVNSSSILLEEFAKQRKDDYVGRLAHFITMRNLGGGIGWIGVLCNNYSTFMADWDSDGNLEEHYYGPYAVSTGLFGQNITFPAYSYDVAVFAHEMGHNIGSPHTHACAWGGTYQAIDNCFSFEGSCGLLNNPIDPQDLGTIMSYCHLTQEGIDFTKGFGTLPGQLVRNYVANASCILDCSSNIFYGCTDPTFHNYDSLTSMDDGSCSGNCSDGIKNGDETDVDCGGTLCQPCNETCTQNYLRIVLTFDNHPEETSWEIRDSSNVLVASDGPYLNEPDGSTLEIDLCLPDGNYQFEAKDSWGDGMCCSSGNGEFIITDIEGIILGSGGEFNSAQVINISLNKDDCYNSLVITGNPTNGLFMATGTLSTSGDVMVSANAHFSSPSILINAGFTVDSGAQFEADLDGCID